MKKIFVEIFAIAIVLSLGATSAFAAGPAAERNPISTDSDICIFVDWDSNGICDNCGMPCQCGAAGAEYHRNCADTDGDGVCDYHAASQEWECRTVSCGGCGRIYTDADGDGICDYCPAGQGRGCGHGHGRGRCGRNYTDADGDGICDNYSTPQNRRGGHGGRGCHGR